MSEHQQNRRENHSEDHFEAADTKPNQRPSGLQGLGELSLNEIKEIKETFKTPKGSEDLSLSFVSTAIWADFAKHDKYTPQGPVPEMDETKKYMSQKAMQLSLTA